MCAKLPEYSPIDLNIEIIVSITHGRETQFTRLRRRSEWKMGRATSFSRDSGNNVRSAGGIIRGMIDWEWWAGVRGRRRVLVLDPIQRNDSNVIYLLRWSYW